MARCWDDGSGVYPCWDAGGCIGVLYPYRLEGVTRYKVDILAVDRSRKWLAFLLGMERECSRSTEYRIATHH